MSEGPLAVNIRGYLKSCGEDAMVARLDDLVADLAAARRENATLREALVRIADAEDWVDVEDCQAEARAALAASPAAEEPQP